MRRTALLLAAPLLAQQQPTFHAAWQDGLDAERSGHWAEALAAYRRARELRPTAAARVVIYGNNLLLGYYPRTRIARCLLELGDPAGAEAELRLAQAEPFAEREAVARRIRDQRLRTAPAQPSPQASSPERETTPPSPHVGSTTPPPSTTPKDALPEPPKEPTRQPAPERPLQPSEGSAEPPRITPPPAPTQLPDAVAPPPPVPDAVAPPPPVYQAPPSETPRPLPWLPAGLGAAAVLALAWVWARRSARKVRLRQSGPRTPAYAPGGLPAAVGPYRIERLLGRGGFADTFLAHHERSGQEVALKVPHLHRSDDPEFRARFHQEAELGALLNHPHLVRILDPGQENARPYLAMEYLRGQGLDERLGREGALPLAECVAIAQAVAEAMTHAHTHGVVHRDLKPGNIMLTEQGPKVMDLGIARVMDAATVTSTYAFLGTPLYAAPEAQLKTHVGPAADRYSLGVILFHMLTGEPPFVGETPFEILHRHRTEPPPRPSLHRPGVPPLLDRLVLRLLDKEPDQRPEDSEVLRVLAEVAEGLSATSSEAPLG
ncbi:serine/threonine-protein kinase [Geothrix sp. PMB-07]|uniref:serine/threonine-protein kinase n=1 Tax=Geothrix sp. PMB-07 TaxID=3068640 RepID=UPI002740A8FE|nr:serine/threonine-protein kinase [Geothrix sp. PMB-07]WLT31421.1 protein kinase [Geothrix sp. PMB-07]